MSGLGITEILFVGGISLLFFGPNHLPSLRQALGKTISNFKKGIHEVDDEGSSRTRLSDPDGSKSSTGYRA